MRERVLAETRDEGLRRKADAESEFSNLQADVIISSVNIHTPYICAPVYCELWFYRSMYPFVTFPLYEHKEKVGCRFCNVYWRILYILELYSLRRDVSEFFFNLIVVNASN